MFEYINNRYLALITTAVSAIVILVGILTNSPMLVGLGVLSLSVSFLTLVVPFIRKYRLTIAQFKADEFTSNHHIIQENELPDNFRFCPDCGGPLWIANEPIDVRYSPVTGKPIRQWFFAICRGGCSQQYPVVIDTPDTQPVFTEEPTPA